MKRSSKYFFIAVLALTSCSRQVPVFMIQSPSESKAPAKYTFINQSEGFEDYTWDIGTTETLKGDSIQHTYLLSGTYNIVLKGQKGKKIREAIKEINVSAPEKCLILIETSLGNMLVELFDDTPLHRDNMLKLAEEGFYDDLLFHRVISGFMIQGGDPNSRNAAPNAGLGSGGPGYQIPAEFTAEHAHVKGALAAARTGDAVNPERKSSGSQFYIVQGQEVTKNQLAQFEQRHGNPYSEDIIMNYEKNGGTPFLDQQYTVFGQVIEGIEILDLIASSKTDPRDRPEKDIKMKIKVIK